MQGAEYQVAGFRAGQGEADGFKVAQMYSAIQTGRQLGMQTLDQNLQELVQRNIVSMSEARGKAANKDNFAGG